MSRIDLKRLPFVALALLLCGAGFMLYRIPVQAYAVECQHAAPSSCVIEQVRSTGTQQWRVALGANATAAVRLLPQRRGRPRVLLYLESATGEFFAAEFEGANAAEAAEGAAAQLNRVLHGAAPGRARVEAAPPALYRSLAWSALAVMSLLVLLGDRRVRRDARLA